jgi:hypothetical protein
MVYILDACIRVALALLKRGVLVRGGIAIGKLQHTEDLLFGTGLLNAHRHDSSGAPPRIVVDPEFVQDGHETTLLSKSWSRAVRQDDFDLSHMVHTLLFADTYHPDLNELGFLARADAETIANEIRRNAIDLSATPTVRAKWRWLRGYWNKTVEGNGHLPPA